MEEIFKEALSLAKGKSIAVVGHIRPDGDCIGSQVALTRVLNTLGYNATAVNLDTIPSTIRGFVKDTPFEDKVTQEIIITVDCADMARTGLPKSTPVLLNIDHHLSNKGYAEHNIVVPTAAATAEVLGAIFMTSGYSVDSITAQALYLGISTDTGQFSFNSTTEQTFALCKELIKLGASPSEVAYELYENERPQKIALLKDFLSTLKMELDGKLCVGLVTLEMFKKNDALQEDTERFVDYARCIQGVEIGALIEERPEGCKASLRAKDPKYRVDLLAQQFNGGGHACAAGLRSDQPLDDFYNTFVEATHKHISTNIK